MGRVGETEGPSIRCVPAGCSPSSASLRSSAELTGAPGRQGVVDGYVGTRGWCLVSRWSRLAACGAVCPRARGAGAFWQSEADWNRAGDLAWQDPIPFLQPGCSRCC